MRGNTAARASQPCFLEEACAGCTVSSQAAYNNLLARGAGKRRFVKTAILCQSHRTLLQLQSR